MDKVYLEVTKSSEKKGMYYIICLSEPHGSALGYLSHGGQTRYELDRKLTESENFGTYFNSKEEALECISKFYIIETKI